MTAEKSTDGFSFCCDKCGEVLDPPKLGRPLDFYESLDIAKAKGWRVVKNSRGKWGHRCKDC